MQITRLLACEIWMIVTWPNCSDHQVDLVEPVRHFLEKAQADLGGITEGNRAVNFFCTPLQVCIQFWIEVWSSSRYQFWPPCSPQLFFASAGVHPRSRTLRRHLGAVVHWSLDRSWFCRVFQTCSSESLQLGFRSNRWNFALKFHTFWTWHIHVKDHRYETDTFCLRTWGCAYS